MSKNRTRKLENPGAIKLKKIWRAAHSGEFEDRHRLLTTLLGYKGPEEFVKEWLRLTGETLAQPSAADIQQANDIKRKEIWQKSVSESAPKAAKGARESTLPAGKMIAISGGLPSLGKRSK